VPGAAIATVAVFLPSFVLVLGFARWIERALERPAFREAISGISAAVVAVILTVTIALAPAAVTGPLSVAVVAASFTAVTFLKRDVAQVAAAAMVAGLVFALARALS
jgi:chromate transporter